MLVALVVGALILAAPAPVAAGPGADAEAGFEQRISHERGIRGLPALASAGDIGAVARNHAQRMANRGEPYHNPHLGREVQGWEVVSENVGVGSSVQQVHEALMNSSTHRAIMLSTELTEVGVGVVTTEDGLLWVVQVFRRPQTQSAGQSPPAAPSAPSAEPPARALPRTQSPTTPTTAAPAPVDVGAVDRATEPEPAAGEPARAIARTSTMRSTAQATQASLHPSTSRSVPLVAWPAAGVLGAVILLQVRVVRRLGLVG